MRCRLWPASCCRVTRYSSACSAKTGPCWARGLTAGVATVGMLPAALATGIGSDVGVVIVGGLGVQSRGEVGWIVSEASRVVCPRVADAFVGRETSEGLEPLGEIIRF